MRLLLAHIIALLFLAVGLSLVPEAQTPCNPQTFGPLCENPHTIPMQGYLPIGEVIAFRDADIPADELIKTDIGIIVGYFWDVPSQTYEYLVVTNPIDPEAELPVMQRTLVFRSEVFNAIN